VQIRLRTEPAPDSPGSRLYVATVVNGRSKALVLKGIEIRGDWQGSYTKFAFVIERWDARTRRWETAINPSRPPRSAPIQDIVIEPGASREIGRALLPLQGGVSGDRMRFKLLQSWEENATSWVSPAFVVDNGARCP
jgi:hypothetical protein